MDKELPKGIEYRYQDKRTGEHVYQVTAYGGYGANGKQTRVRRIVKYPKSMTKLAQIRAVEKYRAQLITLLERHEIVDAKQYTISEFKDKFLEWIRDNRKKKTSYEYTRILEAVCLEIGKIKLHSLSALNISDMYSRLRKQGVSNSTLGHYHDVLSSMYTKAIQWQLVTQNPCKLIGSPDVNNSSTKRRMKKVKFYSFEQANTFLSYIDKEPLKYQLAFQLAMFGGARRSEINGLEWADLNFETGTIHIQRQSNYTPDDGVYEDDPKTESGDRVILPPKHLMELAENYKAEWLLTKQSWADRNKNIDRLFTQMDGDPIYPDTIANQFRKVVKNIRKEQLRIYQDQGLDEVTIEKLLLPVIRFHDLRHTCGTMRKALGESLEDVGAYLGHADKTSTMIYTHAMLHQQKTTSELMAEMIKKSE